MPHLYVIVCAAVACLVAVSGVVGYRHGLDTARGRAAIATQQAVDAAAEAARADAAAESERREAAAVRNATAAAAARERKLKGQIDALQADRPDCRWTESRRVLLNAAVDAANGRPAPAALGVHGELPRAAEARQ